MTDESYFGFNGVPSTSHWHHTKKRRERERTVRRHDIVLAASKVFADEGFCSSNARRDCGASGVRQKNPQQLLRYQSRSSSLCGRINFEEFLRLAKELAGAIPFSGLPFSS
jgi:hypothetical protein